MKILKYWIVLGNNYVKKKNKITSFYEILNIIYNISKSIIAYIKIIIINIIEWE